MSIHILQEILTAARPRARHVSLIITDCTEQFKRRLEILADFAHGGEVTAAITIIGCTPNCHDILVIEMVLVALVNQLVSTSNQCQVIDVTKLFRHFVTKEPT